MTFSKREFKELIKTALNEKEEEDFKDNKEIALSIFSIVYLLAFITFTFILLVSFLQETPRPEHWNTPLENILVFSGIIFSSILFEKCRTYLNKTAKEWEERDLIRKLNQ